MTRHALVDRPSRRSDLIEWYRQAVAELAASGLSLPEFAKRIGVSAATMYAWRKRFAAEPGQQQAYGLVEIEAPAVLVPAPDRSAPGLTVRVSSFSIEVQAGFDEDELRRLLRVVASC